MNLSFMALVRFLLFFPLALPPFLVLLFPDLFLPSLNFLLPSFDPLDFFLFPFAAALITRSAGSTSESFSSFFSTARIMS